MWQAHPQLVLATADYYHFDNSLDTVKEPAWHRNQRRLRQLDRGRLYAAKFGLVPHCSVAKASHRLNQHHGSAATTMPDGAKTSGDWKCKRCKDHNGAAFVNWASRSQCLRCKVHKGSCYGGEQKDTKAPPTKSLAQRQTEQGQRLDKQDQAQAKKLQQQLKRENEKLKLELDNLKGNAGDKEAQDKSEDKTNLKELERCRALYAKLPGEEQKVKDLDAQITEIKGTKAASYPAGEQLKRAEQTLAKKRKKRAAMEEEVKSLQQQLASKQEELATSTAEEETAAKELEKVKSSISTESARDPSHWVGMAEGCSELLKVIPIELLQQQGLDNSSLASFSDLCKKLAACSEAAKAARATAEAGAIQQNQADVTMGDSHDGHGGADVGQQQPQQQQQQQQLQQPQQQQQPSQQGEPLPKDARTAAAEDIEALCSSANPEEAAAGRKCKEMLEARAAKRGSPY